MTAVSVATRSILATILLFSLVTIAFAGAPALPCEFYGKVTIDGNSAPVGTIVVAKVGEQERGQFVLEEEGKYGGPGTFDKRLKVVAEESDLTAGTPEITFWIDGQKAWQEIQFQPGVSLEVDLSAGGEEPAETLVPTPTVIPAQTPSPEPGMVSGEPEEVGEPDETIGLPPALPEPEPTLVPEPQPVAAPVPEPTEEPVASGPTGSADITANFLAVPLTGNAPLTVQFTDISSGNPTMWAWDFGDGEVDTIASPSHTYTTPGVYSITLTASSDSGSDTETKVNYVTVVDPGTLTADFKGEPTSGNAPLSVYFTDESVGTPTAWSWDFGDGYTDTRQDTVHVYAQPGLFTVALTVTDANGTINTKQREAYISILTPGELIADFTAEPTVGTIPLSVQFSDLSVGDPTLWSWDFGDGTSDIVQNPVHIFEKPGNYTVTLTVSNQEGGVSTKARTDVIKAQAVPTPVPTMTVIPIPQVPETFHGTVEIFGEPIQVGGTVEAVVPGYDLTSASNPIKTGKGVFGKSGTFSRKLQVQGIPVGTEIEFWVADEDNSPVRAYIRDDNGTLHWSHQYEPGKERDLDLVVMRGQPTAIPTIPITPVPSECPGVPSIPMTFAGDLHIATGEEYLDSNTSCIFCTPNAAIDTTIEARIDGHDVSGPANPVTLTSAGYFGGGNSSWSGKLSVQGRCVPEGSNLTFWVTAPNWQRPVQAYIKDGSEYTLERPYTPATEQTVHLWVGEIPRVIITPTPTPTPYDWSPQRFYGKAEFNGYPLREGDRVMATTEGVDLNSPTNPITVINFGEFGDAAGNEMLTVHVPYDAINQTDPIVFWIKPQGFEYWYRAWVKSSLSGEDWKTSYPFTPGSITALDIYSTDRAEFMYFYDIMNTIRNVVLPDDYTGW